MKRRSSAFAIAAAALTLVATSCSLGPSADNGDAVTLVIGYQSKTINTVTAGTLLRAQGYLEQRLQDVTEQTGTKYSVEWQDYDTGRRSPPRWWPRRSTSDRWATTPC